MASWSERGSCRRFTLAEIEKATDSFNLANFLGKGGEGEVYKGVMADGSRKSIAVKRLKRSSLDKREVESLEHEIKMLSKIHHANLVSLIGYCQESNEHILVYEFMSNGNLHDKLYKSTNCPLLYEQRLIICIGAARAIEYLHSGASLETKIIHRDVKPHNILLNEKMEAKVSDFGLSRIVPANQTHSSVTTLHLCGTPGYFSPEYWRTGKFTWRVDVFAFGVVLVEVLCNKKPSLYWDDSNTNHKADDKSFSKWARRNVAPVLKGAIPESSLEAFINTAEKCLNKDPYQRPTMNEVVYMLESALKLQKCDCPSSKSGANGEKRPVNSEKRSSRNKSAKFRKSSSDGYFGSSTSSVSTWQERNVESTGKSRNSSKKSPVVRNLSQESPTALLSDIPEVQNSSQESPTALLRDIPEVRNSSQESPSALLPDIPKVRNSSQESLSELLSDIPEVRNSCQESPSALLPNIPGTQDKVVLYYDFASEGMSDYMMTLLFLKQIGVFKVDIEERNPRKNEKFGNELSQFLSEKHKEFNLPQLFIGGKHIGGAKDVVKLYDSGFRCILG